MSRIIIVGLHNKPGKTPLCSSTKSGKLIDRIINEGGFTDVKKTNLFDCDYYPQRKTERSKKAMNWFYTHKPHTGELVVTLGTLVQESFPRILAPTLHIHHPASKRSHAAMNEYVAQTIAAIKNLQINPK